MSGRAESAVGGAGYLVFRDETGRTHDVSLARGSKVAFEQALPIREPQSYRGKRGIVGQVFFSTAGGSLVTDSRIEMDQVLLCDFDPHVRSLSAQPFRIVGDGWTHVPDLFARLSNDAARVYDVKPFAEQSDQANQLVFALTRSTCDELGWEYLVVGELPRPLRTNLRLLAGFRRAPFDPGGLVDAVIAASATPRTIAELDALHPVRALVRPIVLHLIWKHVLNCDVTSRLLDRETLVVAGRGELDGL